MHIQDHPRLIYNQPISLHHASHLSYHHKLNSSLFLLYRYSAYNLDHWGNLLDHHCHHLYCCKRNNDRGETDLNLVCDDSLDATHDADLLADYRLSGGDPGCAYPQDTIETDGKCDDLIDNDADTHADCDNNGDSECLSFSDNIEDPRDYCGDTDGGINQGTKGTVSGEDASTPFIYADSCVDANNLNEYYCGDKPNSYDPLTVTILCPSGCSNGACQGSQPPTGCDNDGICESGQGEDCSSCSADCGVCPPPTSGADITAFNIVLGQTTKHIGITEGRKFTLANILDSGSKSYRIWYGMDRFQNTWGGGVQYI